MGEGEITRIGYAAQLSLFPRFSLLSSSFSVARRWPLVYQAPRCTIGQVPFLPLPPSPTPLFCFHPLLIETPFQIPANSPTGTLLKPSTLRPLNRDTVAFVT